ncbi:MAG: restriction endonuclease subunit S [Candidatus Nitrosopolaris sp.]
MSNNLQNYLICRFIPFENFPIHWERAKLRDTFMIGRERWQPTDRTEEENYVGLENIESGTGRLVNFKPTLANQIRSTKTKFTSTDLLYGKLRPYLNKVLAPAFDGICSTDIAVIKPKPIIDRVLRSEYILYNISKLTYGTKMPRMKISDLEQLSVPLPSKIEQ